MDCQNIVFSSKQSQKRIDRALLVIPSKVFKRILLFALYLLGAKRNVIASFLKMPEESVKTTINRIMKDGLPALRDRRQSTKKCDFPSPVSSQKPQVLLLLEDNYCTIIFGNNEHTLRISQSHQIHLRSVLLSLLQSGLLSTRTVSSALEITSAHCRELSVKLMNNGVTKVLIDKRKGQKQDFRVGLPVKAEIIQHFAARAVTGYSTSSQVLAKIINDTHKTTISPRTVRWHMNKLGLMKIKKTLPELVNTLKKSF